MINRWHPTHVSRFVACAAPGAGSPPALDAMTLTSLAACGGGSDLKRELAEKKKRPGGRIEPLPEIKPYESFPYDPTDLRSPFEPSVPIVAPGVGGVRPDARRTREFLEGFSLDTLRMVGTLRSRAASTASCRRKDGLIHRVLPGQLRGAERRPRDHVADVEDQRHRDRAGRARGLHGTARRARPAN
jgi:type IV pilus assembly protein PilP